MDSGIRLPVKGNTFLERENEFMASLLCVLGDLIASIDRRLSLLRQQAKYLGLSPEKLLDFRNALARIGELMEKLSASPPSSPKELAFVVDQLQTISKALGALGSDVRSLVATRVLDTLLDTAFTDWVNGMAKIPAPPTPKQNIWASGPMN